MTNEVLISWADQDFIVISGNTPASAADVSRRTNGQIFTPVAALNDEVKYGRYFSKSGTYKIKMHYLRNTAGGIIDVFVDGDTADLIFDDVDFNAGSSIDSDILTTKEFARGLHDIHIKSVADGGTGFRQNLMFIRFDLIDEHPVLGEEAPAKEADGMVLLGKHTAEVAESSFTFDFADVDMFNKYSEVILKINGETNASLALEVVINGVGGTANFSLGYHANGSTLTNITNSGGTTEMQIASTTLLSAIRKFTGNVRMFAGQSGTDTLLMESIITENGRPSNEYMSHLLNSFTGGKLTSLKIQTSTSTWEIDTTFTVYGVKK